MNYRYRIKGVAEKAFILRGAHFRIGNAFDTVITENELDFVKERCKIDAIDDMQAQSNPSQSIPINSQQTLKGAKNDIPRATSRTNKGANSSKV